MQNMTAQLSSAAPGAGARLRPLSGWFTTTPARLRLASMALVAGLALAAIVAASALGARRSAASGVGLEAAPLLVATEDLYGSLADADAAASGTYLHAGLEPADQRERYLRDVNTAGDWLVVIAGQVASSSDASAAVRDIGSQLSTYNGLVEEARANNRQGYPVGAAYLNQASSLMRNEILPQATGLYEDAARRLEADYESGTAATDIIAIALTGLLVLALLLGVQGYVTRRTNRVLNPGLAAATMIVAVALPWAIVRLVSEQSALVQSQREGSDPVQVLSTIRILLLRAESDESLALIARGTGDAYLSDFETAAKRMGGNDGQGGLFGEASAVAQRSGSVHNAAVLSSRFAAFLDAHRKVRDLDDGGHYNEAVALSLGAETDAAESLNTSLRDEMAVRERRLDARASDAREGLGALAVSLPAILALAAILLLAGLQPRIGEYR